MVEQLNHAPKEQTLIASILFIEIAGYAELPVFEQIQFTSQMRLLVDRCRVIANSRDLLVVDQEENVALIFPGDPLDCFRVAKEISQVLNGEAFYRDAPLNIGVNLGPIVSAKNELNMPTVSGLGVADAMRVARAGLLREVLIARAFYVVLARVSKEHAALEYREFISDELDESFAIYHIAQPKHDAIGARLPIVPQPGRGVLRRYAVVSILAALGIFGIYQTQRSDAPVTAAQQTPATPTARDNPPPAAATVVSQAMIDPAAAAKVAEIAAAVNFHYALRPSAARVASYNEPLESNLLVDEAIPKLATVNLAIKPWGEVFVDGKKVGVTPPLHKISIPAGKRQITVRNADFLPYRATFDIKPESLLQISHQFAK